MKLSDTKFRPAKGKAKAYKLADSRGLYLHVSVRGAKSWRYHYRLAGRGDTLTIGRYPEVSLAGPDGARRQVEKGDSPATAHTTFNKAFGVIGFDTFSPHGFRSIASTILNEQGHRPDIIERQLAHTESNRVRAAYNHADCLADRRKMMQGWSDYIDRMSNGANVVNIGQRPCVAAPSATPSIEGVATRV